MSDTASDIRRRMRAARSRLTSGERARASWALAERMCHLPAYRRAGRIGAYFAHGGELDPAHIVEHAQNAGKTVYLPVVDGDRMRFARFRPGEQLRPNRFGIPEPAAPRRHIRSLDLDLVIVPLLAFDERGQRIGQGGGFYDRHFGRQRERAWRRPLLVGVGYDLQRCERLPANAWDVPMWRIVTEESVYYGRQAGLSKPGKQGVCA